MKLLFDARWVNSQKLDGMTRFCIELIKELSKDRNVELSFLITNENQAKLFRENSCIFTNHPSSFFEFFQSLRLNKYGFDAVFSPHYLFGGCFRKFILIRTIHDLLPFMHSYFGSSIQWKLFFSTKLFLKRILNNCEGIATISETVKKQISQITDRPIEVISCASMDVNVKNHGGSKSLLYIGRYETYKNVEILIQAMESLQEFTLFLAGYCEETRKIRLLKDSRAKDRIVFLGRIDDAAYLRLLESCDALVMPSKDEGFGLPVVEAMNAGCPVICSDIPIFREIAGKAALFFEVDDVQGLANQVKALEDPEFRKRVIEQSLNNVQRFSWKNSAKELLKFIRSGGS
jgi:glycosyltransferase involved in cell wall biosynthesis